MNTKKLSAAAVAASACVVATLVGFTPAAAQQPNAATSNKDSRGSVLTPGIMAGPGTFGPIGFRRLCDPRSVGLTEWRTEWMERFLKPTDTQKKALQDLELASAKTIEMFSAACPRKLPRMQTSNAQLEMMQNRLEAALQAVKTVRPAFDSFYSSLNDEQKMRLDTLGPKRHGWRL